LRRRLRTAACLLRPLLHLASGGAGRAWSGDENGGGGEAEFVGGGGEEVKGAERDAAPQGEGLTSDEH
jgi:hypothetical protein